MSEDLGTHAYYENVDDMPMLKEFYSEGNKSRNDLSFALQIAFLNYRFHQLREGLYRADKYGEINTVYDSSLLSDSLMALNLYKRGEFPETMFNLYQDLNQNMVSEVSGHPFNGTPDLIVYLDMPFKLMLDHINKRGRDMETSDPKLVDYYKSVWDVYRHWYIGYSQSPVVSIDMSKYNFVENEYDRNTVLDQIEEKLVDLGKLSPEKFHKIQAKRTHAVLD